MEPIVRIMPIPRRNQIDIGRLRGQVMRTHGTSSPIPNLFIIRIYLFPHHIRIL